MAQKVTFEKREVEMVVIDVEGDGKQKIERIATPQDKAQYAGQYSAFQNPESGATTPPGVGSAGVPGPAQQRSGEQGVTTRDLQQQGDAQAPNQPVGQNQPAAGQQGQNR